MQLGDAEWAWLAGLFEGEGHIGFLSVHSVRVCIQMTDFDVLQTVDTLVPSPGGIKIHPKPNPRHRTQYQWYVSRRDDVREFLLGILPWMHSRRTQRIYEALARLDKCRGSSLGKDHCMKGHPLSGDNLYIVPKTGKRVCKRCNVIRTVASRTRKKIRCSSQI